MGKKTSLAAEYIKKLLKDYPTTPIATLAKKAYSEKNLLFKNVEDARTKLRYYAGLSGEESRKKNKNSPLKREISYKYNPFDSIPDSYETERIPYYLPSSIRELAILSDIHFPYHNKKALKATMDYLTQMSNLDAIVLNGDILDFYQLSDFSKDPSKPKMAKELELGRWFLKALREAFPNIPIYYKIGNHEMRLQRWLKVKAPEWIDTDEFRLDVLLRFGEFKIQLIDEYTVIKAGKLNIIHGHEYRGAGGVYPARYIYLKTKVNTICGHYHRASSYIDKNMDGDYHGAVTTGCLCEMSPDYAAYNEWVHGFATVHFNPDGTYHIQNKIIKNGKIY
jgi:predicted phosphodiesterase